jgi:hypothetical protein
MPINIPESVFEKYYDIIDSTITDIFGIDCQLMYIDKVEEISNTFDNVPAHNGLNAHRRRTSDDFKRGDKTYKEVEKFETIRLKVYWDSKSWVKVGGDIVTPDTAIQTIFFASDLDKIQRAKYLIVHDTIQDVKQFRFVKSGEPFPMGLRQYRYFGCFWKRAA